MGRPLLLCLAPPSPPAARGGASQCSSPSTHTSRIELHSPHPHTYTPTPPHPTPPHPTHTPAPTHPPTPADRLDVPSAAHRPLGEGGRAPHLPHHNHPGGHTTRRASRPLLHPLPRSTPRPTASPPPACPPCRPGCWPPRPPWPRRLPRWPPSLSLPTALACLPAPPPCRSWTATLAHRVRDARPACCGLPAPPPWPHACRTTRCQWRASTGGRRTMWRAQRGRQRGGWHRDERAPCRAAVCSPCLLACLLASLRHPSDTQAFPTVPCPIHTHTHTHTHALSVRLCPLQQRRRVCVPQDCDDGVWPPAAAELAGQPGVQVRSADLSGVRWGLH